MPTQCPGCSRTHRAGAHARNVGDAAGNVLVKDTAEDSPATCGSCLPPVSQVDGTALCSSHGAEAYADQAALRQLVHTTLTRWAVAMTPDD